MATEAEKKKAEAKAKAEAEKNKVTSVTVTWNGGEREYSKEVHGDNFMDLAKMFAEKKRGTIA